MPRKSRKSRPELDDVVGLPAHIIVLIAAMLLLFVGGGAGLVYFSITNHTPPSQTTPVAQVHVTSSTTAHATPTVSAVQNPYPPHTGNLVFNDPLKDNSRGYRWDVGPVGNGGSCAFTGGSYHVGASILGKFLACNAEAVTFANLTYEVQMTILKGDRGGMFFRQVGQVGIQGPYYYFSIKIDGSYEFDSFNGKTLNVLQRGTSPAVKTGLNQPNLLAVVAQGSSMDMFVNGQSIVHINDSTSSSGLIGVAADASDQPAEVAFNNAKVWM